MHNIFTLTTLGIIGVLICFIFVLQARRGKGGNVRKQSIVFGAIISLYGIIALLTIRSYYMAPQTVYTNAEHHIIQNLGFSFKERLNLINESQPDDAMWGEEEGVLTVVSQPSSSTQLNFREMNTPLFIEQEEGVFKFSNTKTNTAVDSVLKIQWPDLLTLILRLEPLSPNKVRYSYEITRKDNSSGEIEIPFDKRLLSGYPVKELLRSEPLFGDNFEEVISRLGNSLLVREINYDSRARSENSEAGLLFFPDNKIGNVKINVDNTPVDILNNLKEVSIPDGKYFYLGLPVNSTKRYSFKNQNGETQALIKHPEYHYLYSENTDETQQLFITSSNSIILNSTGKKGYLFDGPESDNSNFHFNGAINYQVGPTEELMKFHFTDNRFVGQDGLGSKFFYAGDTLNVNSVNKGISNLKWLIKIEDLKSSNPFSTQYLYGYIFLVIVLSLLSLYISPKNNTRNRQIMEASVYMFLIFILTVKSVILWRVTTFIPEEGVTYNIFNLYRRGLFETNFLAYQIPLTFLFFFSVIVGKLIINKSSRLKLDFIYRLPFWGVILVFIVFHIINAVLRFGLPSFERLTNVFFPLILFFTFDFFIQKRALVKDSFATLSKEAYILSLINWSLCAFNFLLFDTGYTVIFLIFTLLYLYIKSTTFKDYYLRELKPKSLIRRVIWVNSGIFIVLGIAIFLFYHDRMISYAFRNIEMTVGIVSLLGIGFIFYNQNFSKRLKFIFSGVVLLLFISTYFLSDKIESKLLQHNRMLYRSEILHKTPDQIIELEEFQSGNDIRVLQAAQNQWLINYYNDKATWTPFFDDYFKILPHFQRGASYEFQISDLIAIRYLSSEHGHLLIFLIILFTAGLLVINLQYSETFNIAAKIRIALLILLFTSGYTIWLTTTNRLAFVGQDFPMLSLNSLLSLLIGFSSLGFVIISAYDNSFYNTKKISDEDHETHLKGFRNNSGRKVLFFYFLPLLAISVSLLMLKEYDSEKFDLNDTMGKLEQKFNGLNAIFNEYQNEHKFNSAEEAFYSFDEYLATTGLYDTWFEGEDNSFYKSAYGVLKNKFIKTNSSQNLIHLREESDGNFIFAVNGYYYTTYNPDEFQKGWKGNLVEGNSSANLNITDEKNETVFSVTDYNSPLTGQLGNSQFENFRVSYIPKGWLKGNRSVIIMSQARKTPGESYYKINTDNLVVDSRNNPYAFIVKGGDRVFLNGHNNSVKSLSVTERNYNFLARNVWLNGKSKFYYPLEERSVWTYQFSNFVKEALKNDETQWDLDVGLTLDVALMEKITQDLKNYYQSKRRNEAGSVVAVRSDGAILALSDYTVNLPFYFNPNKEYQYKDYLDALYLKPDRRLERKVFGNQNLLLMKPGPGSTFKPFLFGSITSQIDLGWEKLGFGGIGNYPLSSDKKGNTLITHFGGVQNGFRMVSGSVAPHSGYNYLLKSTNSYNSMVLFLGSFDYNTLSRIFYDGKYLAKGYARSATKNFPIINYGGQNFHVSRLPKDWENPKSVFHQGLWLNFHLPISNQQKNSKEGKLSQFISTGLNDEYLASSNSSFKLWSQPNESYLLGEDRAKDLSNAIGNIAMGGFPIEVTPFKMAEMAVRLFGFNSALQPTVLSSTTQSKKTFSIGDWQSEDQLAQFYVKNLFNPLFNVPRIGTIPGLRGLSQELEQKGIYMYAKTGTISGGDVQDKTLLVVLSKGDIHNINHFSTAKSLRDNEFVTLYFYLKGEGVSWANALPMVQRTIKNTVESDGFKNFNR